MTRYFSVFVYLLEIWSNDIGIYNPGSKSLNGIIYYISRIIIYVHISIFQINEIL